MKGHALLEQAVEAYEFGTDLADLKPSLELHDFGLSLWIHVGTRVWVQQSNGLPNGYATDQIKAERLIAQEVRSLWIRLFTEAFDRSTK